MNRTVHTRFASLAHTHSLRVLILLATLVVSSIAAMAQTTSFTYQGRLTDGGNPANGSYDIQVKLYDALTGGNQIGATASLNGVAVSGGVFTVTLDFGATAFPGANRWAEISAKAAGAANFTTLTPRQPVTSTPYAIQSLNAANATTANGLSASCNGCVTGAQIGSLPSNSGSYIQNTSTQQANTNFNISGNGIIGSRVGIATGAATPATALDVNGIISLKDGNTRLLSAGVSSESFTQTIHIGVNNSRVGGYDPTKQGGFFRVDGRSGGFPLFQFFTSVGDTSLVSIMPDGKVGFGTNTPADRLEIGTFSDPADNYLTIKTSGGNQRRSGIKFRVFNNDLGFTIENDERLTSNGLNILRHTVNAQLQPVTFSALFIDKQNGNIGIGTTSPGSLLTLKSGSVTAPALEVNQGAIKVTGAGLGTSTPVFAHRATAQTISAATTCSGQCTVIDHPLTNGDPNAILIITPNWNSGVYVNHAVGVYYDGSKWNIFNQDLAAMTVGSSFNVLVVKP